MADDRPMFHRIRDAMWAAELRLRPNGSLAQAVPMETVVSAPAAAVVVNGGQPRISINVAVNHGSQCISDRQMAQLKRLVDRIVGLGGGSFGKVWGKLNRRFGVAAARNLDQRDYEAARAYLDKWRSALEPPLPDRRG